MRLSRHTGFTLIELIVTLAVVSILMGVAVPSLIDTVRSGRTSAEYNRAVGALLRARSEAVKSTAATTVCARTPAGACGSDWNEGWLVFVDRAPRSSGAIASLGAEDTLLASGEPVHDDVTLSLTSSPDGTAPRAEPAAWISYRSDGGTGVGAASLLVCDARGEDRSRVANVTITGDVRRGRPGTDADGGVPRDAFGRAIDCGDAGGAGS